MFSSRVICLLIAGCTFISNAEVITHYKTKTFKAESVNVITPQLLEFTAFLTNDRMKLSTLYIQTSGLIFDEDDQKICEKYETDKCKRLLAHLELKDVRFKLGEPVGISAFNGQVYVAGENLRHTMIREGWYKFDYKVGRNHYDILLQKEAECMRKGIWKSIAYSETDMRCQ